VNSLPKTVTRQTDSDLNPGPSATESMQHANHSATELGLVWLKWIGTSSMGGDGKGGRKGKR